MIQLHNVSVSYQGEVSALSGVTLHVRKGEFLFLTGTSGAGKSTLLRLVFSGLQPTSGQILVDGQNLNRMSRSQVALLRRSVGVVFQDFKLLANRTVFENVAITLEVLGWGAKDIGRKVYQILKQMGLEQKMDSTPLRLSGGEQQRVALARALVNAPKILLADEPTGNLDEQNKEQILSIFRDANIRGTTVLVATHDRRMLESCKREFVVLEKGRIVEDTREQL